MSSVFCFSLKTQFDNIGDILINRELIIESIRAGDTLVDASRCPREFFDSLDISPRYVYHSSLLFLLNVLKEKIRGRTVYYFLNPGGLGGDLSARSIVASIIYSVILFGFKILGIRVTHVGFSMAPVSGKERFAAKLRSKACWKVLPRDKSSGRYLHSIGGNVDGFFPDLAFLNNTMTKSEKNGDIVVSFRFDGKHSIGFRQAELLLESIFSDCREERVIFYCQVDRDSEKLKELYNKFSHLKNSVYLHNSSDFNVARDVYGKASYVVSNRLHCLLMGALSGAIPVATITRVNGCKIYSLFSDLNMTDNVYFKGGSWPGIYSYMPVNDTISVVSLYARKAFSEIFSDDKK